MPKTSAEAAVGHDDAASDWQLRPAHHANELPAEAAALKRVLVRPEIEAIINRFRTADKKAIAAQVRYKRVGRTGLYAATMATLVGALFLLPIEPWLKGPAASIASATQVLGLVIAFLASRFLSIAKPFDAWMKNRAEAEIARIALFDAVADASEPAREGEIPLLPLALEYFRRYQLDVQRRYYGGRGAQQSAAAWRNNQLLRASLLFTVASMVLGALLFLHVAFAWGLPVPVWLLMLRSPLEGPEANHTLLALGVVASALYGLGVARSLMDLDERNASRYLTTAQNLEFLTETRLSAAREAAAAGNPNEVRDFIGRVQEQISSEHREWILLSGRVDRPDKLRYARRS